MKNKILILLTLLATSAQAMAQAPFRFTNNTLSMGLGASDKYIEFVLTKSGASANPKFKWNNSSSVLQFSNNGTSYFNLGTVGTTASTTNASFFPLFVSSSSNGIQSVNLGTGLSFNPSTNALTTTTFSGALSGNATTATTATNANNGLTASTATNASYFPLFVASSSNGNQPFNLGTGISFNPSTNILTTTTFSGALSGNATTATSATTATNSNNGATVAVSNSASYFPLFAASSSNSNQPFNLGTGLSFNPSTNVLTTTTFSGALSGNATTATTATNATNVATTATTTNTSFFPLFVASSSNGNQAASLDTTLTYNPSTDTLTAATFAGNASTATSATNVSGTVAIANGGTGQTTKAAAFDALSPMTTSGDVIYGGASGTGTRLAKGADGQVLTLASGLPSWSAVVAPGVNYTAQTSTYSAVISDFVNATSGTFTVTLPTAVGQSGKSIWIKQSGTGIVTVATTSAQTIDGASSFVMPIKNEIFQFVSDGSNWFVDGPAIRTIFFSFGGASNPSACTADPCTVYKKNVSGLVVNKNGTGQYKGVIGAGTCSDTLVCNSTSSNDLGGYVMVRDLAYASSSTEAGFRSLTTGSGSSVNGGGDIICTCQR